MSLDKGYAAANGVSYYYEIHGTGEPLLLLHGGLGSIGMFEPDLPALAASHRVVAVDLYGHRRTALTDRPVSIVDMRWCGASCWSRRRTPRRAFTPKCCHNRRW